MFIFNRKQALAAKAEAEKEGIVVPLTLEDYCIKPKHKPANQEPQVKFGYEFLIYSFGRNIRMCSISLCYKVIRLKSDPLGSHIKL